MKVLVLGASGFLGSTIYAKLKTNKIIETIGTFCNSQCCDDLYKLNILDIETISNFIFEQKFDVIVWSLVDIENEQELSKIGLNNIIQAINENVKLIYISTTISSKKNQSEEVEPEYRTKDMYLANYVNGKIDGEKLVKEHEKHVIIRPGSIYGIDGFGRLDNRSKLIASKINACEVYARTANMYTSFVEVNDLSDAIIELMNIEFSGIINIAGNIPVSHYNFSIKRAIHMELDSKYIIPDYKDNPIEYTLNTTLCSKILKINIRDI